MTRPTTTTNLIDAEVGVVMEMETCGAHDILVGMVREHRQEQKEGFAKLEKKIDAFAASCSQHRSETVEIATQAARSSVSLEIQPISARLSKVIWVVVVLVICVALGGAEKLPALLKIIPF